MNKMTKRCVAVFASLAMAGTLGVASVAGIAGTAFAAGASASDDAPWATANANKQGSITIHKKEPGNNGNGSPIKGAKFTVTPVTSIDGVQINLKSQEGWIKLANKVKNLNEGKIESKKIVLGTPKEEKETGANGQAKFEKLDIGLYKVEETKVPDGYISDFKPFFMTVPEITRKNQNVNNTYTYDVQVTPKNSNVKDSVKKTVNTGKTVGAGDKLQYKIEAKVNIPTEIESGKITKDNLQGFAIYDDAVTNAYESVASTVVKKVKIKDDTSQFVANDYEVTSTVLQAPNNDRTRIKVTFKDSGLEKIANKMNKNNNNVTIEIQLEFKLNNDLNAFAGKGKSLVNKSGFIPGHGKNVPDVPTPGGEVETKFRKFHIVKQDATDTSKKLAGAKFKAFTDPQEAKKCAKDPSVKDACKAASEGFSEKITKNNTGETDDYIAKVVNNETIYLVETEAPKDYVRSEQVYSVTLTANIDEPQVISIANIPTKDHGNWFKLPKTGAAGVIIFAVAGFALVSGGAFLYLRNRNREEQAA